MKRLILSICMSCLLFVSGGCSRSLDSDTGSGDVRGETSPLDDSQNGVLDSDTGQWNVRREISPLDDSQNVFMVLRAEDNVLLHLVIRCMEGKTDVIIDYYTVLERIRGWDLFVWSRFDQEPAERKGWRQSTTGTAIFAYNGVSWASKIASARKLFVRTDPEVGPVVEGTFNLKGSVEAMRPLREACGW